MAAQESRRRGCWVPGVLHPRVNRKSGGGLPKRALEATQIRRYLDGHFTLMENEPLVDDSRDVVREKHWLYLYTTH